MTLASIFLICAVIVWLLDAFRVPTPLNLFSLGWAFVGIAWLCGAAVLHL